MKSKDQMMLEEAYQRVIESVSNVQPGSSHFDNIPLVVQQLNSAGPTASGERVKIADIKDSRGRIGKQGFTAEGVIEIINFATGSNYTPTSSLKDVLTAVKSSPSQVKAIEEFLERTPVITTRQPDGSTHLKDGHHRSFLADQLGMDSLPTNAPVSERQLPQKPQSQ